MSQLPHRPSLPPRKWYTLEQAAKRITKLTGEEIKVEDLLHYWKTYQLEICTPISYNTTADFFILGGVNIEIEKIEWFDIDFFFDEEIYLQIREDNFSMITFGEKKNDILQAKIDGLIILLPEVNFPNAITIVFENLVLEEQGLSFDFVDYLTTQKDNKENKRTYFKLILNEDIKIPLSALFVLNDELDLFLQGKSNAIETAEEIEKKQHKEPATKTLNAQAEFIRNLITIHYGEKVSNTIRNELENPRSRIVADFEKNGLKAPSGKTVDRWINQI